MVSYEVFVSGGSIGVLRRRRFPSPPGSTLPLNTGYSITVGFICQQKNSCGNAVFSLHREGRTGRKPRIDRGNDVCYNTSVIISLIRED
jgi:hypothetical protein